MTSETTFLISCKIVQYIVKFFNTFLPKSNKDVFVKLRKIVSVDLSRSNYSYAQSV
jgi:hypothetical protein